MKRCGRGEPHHRPWSSEVVSAVRLACFVAAIVLPSIFAVAEDVQGLYYVDRLGIGSCYDADLSLMLPAYAYAYLEAGTLEVRFSNPPSGFPLRERVVLLGDSRDDFSAQGSGYIQKYVLGKEILLAFDSVTMSADGSFPVYVYLAGDGTCVNFELVRHGLARVAPRVPFQFRSEFEMYEKQAREKRRGIWMHNQDPALLNSGDN